MTDNPIVDEVHRVRAEMLAEFGGDMDALIEDLRRKTDVAAATGRRVVTTPQQPKEVPDPESKKAG